MPGGSGKRDDLADRIAGVLTDPVARMRLAILSFHVLLILLLIPLVLMVLSLLYADSSNPLSIFSVDNGAFSYSGRPVSIDMTSAGDDNITCMPQDRTFINIAGASTITAMPALAVPDVAGGDIMITCRNGTAFTMDGPLTITSSADTMLQIMTRIMPEIGSASMSLDFGGLHFFALRHGNSYDLLLNGMKGSYKSCATDGGPYRDRQQDYIYDNRITATGGGLYLNGIPSDFVDAIEYMGFMKAETFGGMTVSMTTQEVYYYTPDTVSIAGADGGLVVFRKHYFCDGADPLVINALDRSKSILFMLQDGKCSLAGKARDINFRFQEIMSEPVKIILREAGNLTFVLSTLLGMLALVIKRLVGRVLVRK